MPHNLVHPEVFKHYMNNYFIETGSNVGNGIQEAVEAGFPNIISIELSEELHNICVERFRDEPSVTLVHGDSVREMAGIISLINEPITFWLDAHYCGGCWIREDDSEREILSANTSPDPLLGELWAIKKHPIKEHTIMIDNYAHFGHEPITQLLWEINRDYVLRLIRGTYPHDVILAKL